MPETATMSQAFAVACRVAHLRNRYSGLSFKDGNLPIELGKFTIDSKNEVRCRCVYISLTLHESKSDFL
jgi:hypothetical protein